MGGLNAFYLCRRVRFAAVLVLLCLFGLGIAGCGRNAANNAKGSEGPQHPSDLQSSGQFGNGTIGEGSGGTNKDPFLPWKQGKPDLPGAILCVVSNGDTARPQSGIDQADLVYEIEAEGGITRFLAVFYHRAPGKIGPIRSMRMYYASIARAYNSPVAHAGGNNDVLALLKKGGYKNLDEIYGAGEYFYRSRDRMSPDNLYTSSQKLLQGAKDKRFSLTPPPEMFGDLPGGDGLCSEISIPFRNTPRFRNIVTWKYANAAYERYVNDSPHQTDGSETVKAANVVVIEAVHKTVPIKVESKDDYEMDIKVVGSGKAVIFTAGKVFHGTWIKEKAEKHMSFFRQNTEMVFEKGPIWIEVVPDLSILQYK